MHSQQACSISQQVLSPLVHVMQQPSLVRSHLHVPQQRLHWQTVIPFIVQLGLYVSPVGFSSHIVPAQWQLLYALNPMVGIIDGFRWCIVGGESPIYLPGFVLSLVVTAAFLWIGVSTFRRIERGFADLI